MPDRLDLHAAATVATAAPGLARLPMARTFVVKLADAAGARCRGQLEHVASGRRLHFGSARELIKVLRQGVEEPA